MQFNKERLFKKGEVNETPSGQKVLLNGDGGAYAATDGVIAIWKSFNGDTVREVADELAITMSRNPNELIAGLDELTRELVKANLLSSELRNGLA